MLNSHKATYIHIIVELLSYMNYRNLPLNGLKTFESFARHLHMGKAAEELGVTNSAVSHQIKKLEQFYQVPLIYKDGKNRKLTARGVLLLEDIQKGFAFLHQATLNLDPDLTSGKIRLGCTSALCLNWLLPILSQFFSLNPSINFELVNITPNTDYIADDIDIAICYGRPTTHRLSRKLIDIQLFAVANQALFVNQSMPKHLADILIFPILLDNEKNWESLISKSTLPAEQLSFAHSIRFFDSSHAIEAARQGLGVALADQMEVWNDLEAGKLIRLPSEILETDKAYYLVTDKTPSKRVNLFSNWLINEIAKRHQQRLV